MTVSIDRSSCLELDRLDPLADFRPRFVLPDGLIYLDGNSLGPLSRQSAERLATAVREDWGTGLVRSWSSAHWVDLPARVGEKIAALIGASTGEVVVGESTTVCLYKVLRAALAMRPGRTVLLTEEENFHTDLYVAAAAARDAGATVRVLPRAELAAGLDDGVAVLMLTHVDYRTGEMHDMAAMSAAAHAAGAAMVWDLSHSTAAVPLDVDEDGADLAVGCGYKYLNGGPGAPAFMFVRRNLQGMVRNPVPGWLGHADPFAFEPGFRGAPGMQSLVTGTPHVLQLVPLEAAVDLWLEADMAAVRTKSIALTELFITLVEAHCADAGFVLASPRAPARRGSQVALRHPKGYAIVQALIERGVVGDFRTPDVCRFGFAPLYVRHVDVWDAVVRLRAVLDEEAHLDDRFAVRASVT